jgi:hypothetical protein
MNTSRSRGFKLVRNGVIGATSSQEEFPDVL